MLINTKEAGVAQDFYPFVDNGQGGVADATQVRHPARIAVYDDAAAAPRVVVVEPKDVREYLEEITLQVTQLSSSQGGTIPFMVIREIVENFIHAYFMEPTISILDHGNTIRFSDQGPGIAQKERALQYGTTSATEEMRRYIRGVGSGLPYVHQYMIDKGGSLKIDDNISGGTVVTISTMPQTPQNTEVMPTHDAMAPQGAYGQWGPWNAQGTGPGTAQGAWQPWQAPGTAWQSPAQTTPPSQQAWTTWNQGPQPAGPQGGFAPQGMPTQGMPSQGAFGQQVPTASGMAQPGAPYASPVPTGGPAQAMPSWPALSARGRAVLDYLAVHEAVGPSDLARTYGESQPTWTRELQALEEAGLIRKDGQKRRLTAMGQAFITSSQNPQSF